MPAQTPIYSAFAIVSIESIWPSSQGDEVPINYQDLVFLNERLSGGSEEFKDRQEELARERTSRADELKAIAPTLINETKENPSSTEGVARVFNFNLNSESRDVPDSEDSIFVRVFSYDTVTFTENPNAESVIGAISTSQNSANSILGILKDSETRDSDEFPNDFNTREAFIAFATAEKTRTEGIIANSNYKKTEQLVNEIAAIDNQTLDAGAYGTYPQAEQRLGFSSILTSENAYKKRRGYFKIIPLNVIQVATSTSTGGAVGQSNFNVTFTMDDVIIIADTFGAGQIQTNLPRAIPIKIDEVFDEINRRMPNSSVSQNVRETVGLFGMRAFRISGNDFTFNIEDIVEANDTVTIWLYHDPKEFEFFKLDGEEVAQITNEDKERAVEFENDSRERIVEERGFFAKKITYRTISENNETTLEVFIDHGVYVNETDTELISEINNTNNATLSYLTNLNESGEFVNFDNFRLKQRTGVINHPSLCTPDKIERYRKLSEEAATVGFRRISLSYQSKIRECQGSINIQDISLNSLIETATILGKENLSVKRAAEETEEFVPRTSEKTSPPPENPINQATLEDFVFNKDFSHVIGSGSRRSQDDFRLLDENQNIISNPPKTFAQAIFVKTGILSEYSTPERLATETTGNITLEPLQVFEFLVEIGKEAGINPLYDTATRRSSEAVVGGNDILSFNADLALSGILNSLNTNTIPSPENITFDENGRAVPLRYGNSRINSEGSENTAFTNVIKNTIRTIFLPNIPRYNEDKQQNQQIAPSRNNYARFSQAIITSISGVLRDFPENTNPSSLAEIWRRRVGDGQGESSVNGVSLSNLIVGSEIDDIFQSIISYTGNLEILAQEALQATREQNSSRLVKSAGTENKPITGFYNKRTMLTTQSHGETPYLALKGHISSVEVKYGAVQGTNTVTVTGAGYEKILNENIVYYEDLFSPTGGAFGQAIEAYPIYSQMLPPKGMLSFIESNAPRFILIGKQAKQTIDAKNMSLRFTRRQRFSDETSTEPGLSSTKPPQLDNLVEKYFPENQILVRGLATIDINIKPEDARPENFSFDKENVSLRIFYPVNYLNTSRIREMINSLEAAYASNPDEAVIKIPIKLAPMQSISNNLMAFNGPKEVNHLFVDETGRLRQRLAYEAWERPPAPQHTPTITDKDILASGSSFSRNSDPVVNMVDIRANYLTTAQGLVDARFAGRTLSGGNDYIPLIVINDDRFSNNKLLGTESNSYEVISEPFFRYGMRYRLLNDVYTTSTQVAKRKSILYQGFFSKPLKTAKVSLRGNTSYRAGETVLTCLDSYKYRSREIIDVKKTIEWLEYLKSNKELIPLYIGVDKRWLEHDSYYATVPLDQSKEYGYWLSQFKSDPEMFILDAFIDTLTNSVSTSLDRSGTKNFKFITPEYFPTTYWASKYLDREANSKIKELYNLIYDRILSDSGSISTQRFENLASDYYSYIRMQNFRATSYYIDAVQHSYVHGEQCITNLTLNHGQDNLVLLEPFSMKPIGFMSVERRMRIGYDDIVIGEDGEGVFNDSPDKNTKDRLLWEIFKEKKSDIQTMYIEQYEQDAQFKNNSFLYTAQKYRNSSNFMYELALELGLVK